MDKKGVVKRRLKKPKEIVCDTVNYPFKSARNFGKTAYYTFAAAQTGAAAYGIGLAAKNAYKAGKSTDEMIDEFYRFGKDFVQTADKMISSMNNVIRRVGVGFREEMSILEKTLEGVDSDIQSELDGKVETRHSNEELLSQQELLRTYRTEIKGYEQNVKQIIVNFVDMKHELRSIIKGLGEAGNKVRPEGSWIDNLLKIQERGLKAFGGKDGEQYRKNFDRLEEAFDYIDRIQAITEKAIYQLRQRYEAEIAQEGADRYAARQGYLTRSLEVLKEFNKAVESKKKLEELDLETDCAVEQKTYEQNITAIIGAGKRSEDLLKKKGYDFPKMPAFATHSFPIAAVVLGVYLYGKLCSLEKKILNNAKVTYTNIRDFLSKEVN